MSMYNFTFQFSFYFANFARIVFFLSVFVSERENPNPVVQKFFNKVLENNINLTNVIISNEKSVAQPLALESLTLEVKQQSALNLVTLIFFLI